MRCEIFGDDGRGVGVLGRVDWSSCPPTLCWGLGRVGHGVESGESEMEMGHTGWHVDLVIQYLVMQAPRSGCLA